MSSGSLAVIRLTARFRSACRNYSGMTVLAREDGVFKAIRAADSLSEPPITPWQESSLGRMGRMSRLYPIVPALRLCSQAEEPRKRDRYFQRDFN